MDSGARNRLVRDMRYYLTALSCLLGALPLQASAADSYRWLTVTIDTPWAIFIFLLPMVLPPIILMAVLYWRYAIRPSDKAKNEEKQREIAEKQSP